MAAGVAVGVAVAEEALGETGREGFALDFARTSKVRLEAQQTSTVNMMAFAPSLSTRLIRASEAERSLLR
jgi:hypothetical protein